MSQGGAVLFTGLALSGCLFVWGWVQLQGIRKTEVLNQAISGFEACLYRLAESNVNPDANLEAWRASIQHVYSCSNRISGLMEKSHPAPLAIWQSILEDIPEEITPEQVELLQERGNQRLHSMRPWADQDQLHRLEQTGLLLLGGTGLLLAILGGAILRLRKVTYRADYPLPGLVPICSWCHSVRDHDGEWKRVDQFLQERLGTRFTHSLCPECMGKEMEKLNEPTPRT